MWVKMSTFLLLLMLMFSLFDYHYFLSFAGLGNQNLRSFRWKCSYHRVSQVSTSESGSLLL